MKVTERISKRLSARSGLLAVISALLLLASPATAKEFVFDFGSSGTLGGQLSSPRGIAINQSGNGGVPAGTIYVSDFNNRRVQSFDSDGNFLRAWGWDVVTGGGTGFEVCTVAANCQRGEPTGGAAGQFDGNAGGIAVNQATGDVYVYDRNNFRVQQFSATGAFIRAWGKDVDSTGGTGAEVCEVAANCKAGEAGAGAGMFGATSSAVAGLATDSSGNLYVYDTGNARVQKFSSAGAFLATAGWDVDALNPSTAYEVCTVAANCKAGVGGPGPGQFPTAQAAGGFAASPAGDLYVAAGIPNNRITRLSSALALADPSFASAPLAGATPSAVAVNPANGHLFLTREDANVYELDPTGQRVLETTPSPFASPLWLGLALNQASGRMYATVSGANFLRVFDLGLRPGATLYEATAVGGSTATLEGAVNPVGAPLVECFFEYDTVAYKPAEAPHGQTAPCEDPDAAEVGSGIEPVFVHADLSGLSPGTEYHFRLVATNAEGRSETEEESFETLGPVLVEGPWSQEVGFVEATLKAQIDPEGDPTTYRFEWGLTAAPYEYATAELSVGSDSATHEVALLLEGLSPGTDYHYRVIATSHCNPGEPAEECIVESSDRTFTTYLPAAVETDCPNDHLRDGTPSAALPDCRAYEMVSPPDKNGGDIIVGGSFGGGLETAYRQASPGGNRLTYSSSTAFGDSLRGARSNQYLASRGSGGWSSHSLLPPQGTTVFDPKFSVEFDIATNFQAFTPDLCHAILRDHNLEPLAPGAIAGFTNLYLRDNCGPDADTYEALTVGGEPTLSQGGVDLLLQGRAHSADLGEVVFSAVAALDSTPEAAENLSSQIYAAVRTPEGRELRLVSVLPDGQADPGNSKVGSRNTEDRSSNLSRAVSTDGSRVFWSSGSGSGSDFTYLRTNPAAEQSALASGGASGGASGEGQVTGESSEVTGVVAETGAFAPGQTIYGQGIPRGTTIAAVGAGTLTLSAEATQTSTGATGLVAASECLEPEKACTVPVTSGGGDTTFWTADPSGSKAIYGEGGGLYELDVDKALAGEDASAVSEIAAGGVGGLAGAAEDLSRLYFTSSEALDEGAQAGETNLYLREGGEARFVAELAAADRDVGFRYRVDDPAPLQRATRTSPDGRILTFMSRSRSLAEEAAGYDSTDIATGEAAAQVYRYDAAASGGAGELACLSCNPSGARPEGEGPPSPPYSANITAGFPAAAWLPTCELSNYCKRALTANGDRVFFNAFDALVPEDRNASQDVYEWEAPGTGSCTKADPRYFERNGGCVRLISTGQSGEKSDFLDASASGADVFFTTASSIDPRDLGSIDVYDARAQGGFPPPPPPTPPCVGDACQNVPAPPNDPTPASTAVKGPGDPAPSKTRRRKCRAARQAAKRGSQAKRKSAKRCRRAKRRAGR